MKQLDGFTNSTWLLLASAVMRSSSPCSLSSQFQYFVQELRACLLLKNYKHPMQPLFIQIPNFWAWADNLGRFHGVFVVRDSADSRSRIEVTLPDMSRLQWMVSSLDILQYWKEFSLRNVLYIYLQYIFKEKVKKIDVFSLLWYSILWQHR